MSSQDAAPAPLASGSFAIYTTEDGGMHISMKLEGEDETRHIPVSPMMLKLLGGRRVADQMLANLGPRQGG